MAKSAAQELLLALPMSLRQRFRGIPALVQQIINGDDEQRAAKNKTTKVELEETQFLTLVWMLDRFLKRGTIEAERSIETFETLNVMGFAVGSSLFERDSAATTRGSRLSSEIRSAVAEGDSSASWLVQLERSSVAEAVYRIHRWVSRGEPVD